MSTASKSSKKATKTATATFTEIDNHYQITRTCEKKSRDCRKLNKAVITESFRFEEENDHEYGI